MLTETILLKFIEIKIDCLLFKDISVILDFIKEVMNTINYNFSFIATLHKVIINIIDKFNKESLINKLIDFEFLVKNLIEVI